MKTKLFSSFVLIIAVSSCLFSASAAENPTKPFVVVLDAGHGGHDHGNKGNGYKESEISLNIVLKIGAELEKLPNVKVIYTRKSDVFIELRERAAIANKADADLFVSVHCNAHHSDAYGAETFVLGLHKSQANFEVAKKENEVIYLEDNYQEKYGGFDPNAPESLIGMVLMQEEYLDQSILLASLVQNNVINNLKRKDRSVKQAGFWVLHNTHMPSVLIETGFLTNKSEGAYLNSAKGQAEMAREIGNAIKAYINSLSVATEKIKDPEIEKIQVEKTIESTKEDIYEGVTFKVQLAATSKKLDPKPSNFKGLKDVSREKESGLFKYYYGDTSDYKKIQVMKTFVQQKGYPSAYIVAFKKGKKVNLPEVLKSKAN
ncbi:N-acetylmuramoyl-L-alanine amidase family protein [Aequorivita vladivostokensis]|uniref:N-acetylmuramoyl-L-alanine amidase n=1 Tax=Aequorivita vladivostokensis TaxID=171194 RepID=A0ABR5DHC3_9FLAO|nr:N-acetylmuramoyl-L-alanine amidase [Aequorivita vladivostokensis]KJJ38177.1 N-acetylmuramoyl-L-alanine amidase [Aequorivita vladivostokensis]